MATPTAGFTAYDAEHDLHSYAVATLDGIHVTVKASAFATGQSPVAVVWEGIIEKGEYMDTQYRRVPWALHSSRYAHEGEEQVPNKGFVDGFYTRREALEEAAKLAADRARLAMVHKQLLSKGF